MKPMLWPVLGLVRFFLALVVAGAHLKYFDTSSFIMEISDRFGGTVAVIGFLVVSGFSIAASHAKSPTGFYGRRALRILPLYVLALVAAALCSVPLSDSLRSTWPIPSVSTLVQNLFFLQGFTTEAVGTNVVVWSLSVEVLFYVLTPMLARMSQGSLIAVAAASLALFVESSRHQLSHYPTMQNGQAVVFLGWAWLAGFIAFRAKDHLIAGLVLGWVFTIALSFFSDTLPVYWKITIAVPLLAIALGGRFKAPAWAARAGEFLGDASYPLYLFHFPVYILLIGLGVHPVGVVFCLAALVVAVALDRLFDQPFKKAVVWALRKFEAKPKISLAGRPA